MCFESLAELGNPLAQLDKRDYQGLIPNFFLLVRICIVSGYMSSDYKRKKKQREKERNKLEKEKGKKNHM